MPRIGLFAPLAPLVGGRLVIDPDETMRFGWPGVYFEARFRGTAVTATVAPNDNFPRLLVDAAEHAVLTRPGKASMTIAGLWRARMSCGWSR